MISKTKLKELAVYKQQKRCDEDAVFVVEGAKMCAELLAANVPVRTICATNSWLSQHSLLPECTEVFEVDDVMLERISGMKTPNEVWMLLDRSALATNQQINKSTNQPPLILALDHLQDPGNLGTIIRTADWFGIRHIVCSEGTVSCFNPKVVQSTMGGIFRTHIEYTNLPSYLSQCGKPVFGALLNGEDIWQGQGLQIPPEGAVLVIGNESKGITPEVQQLVTRKVLIPNLGGTAESLNASVACAILMAEMLRR